MKTAFIGHRNVFSLGISHILEDTIKKQIERGCKSFTMGTQGAFDKLALDACRRLRQSYPDIEIEVVLTDLHSIKKDPENGDTEFDDVKTVMFEIDECRHKSQTTVSNRKMIDGCDTLICYVDPHSYNSGAKSAMLYALKHGLRVINMHSAVDRLFTCLAKEKSEESRKNFADNINNTTKKLSDFKP